MYARKIASSFVVLSFTAIVAVSAGCTPIQSKAFSPLNSTARFWGVGWSEGYHQCPECQQVECSCRAEGKPGGVRGQLQPRYSGWKHGGLGLFQSGQCAIENGTCGQTGGLGYTACSSPADQCGLPGGDCFACGQSSGSLGLTSAACNCGVGTPTFGPGNVQTAPGSALPLQTYPATTYSVPTPSPAQSAPAFSTPAFSAPIFPGQRIPTPTQSQPGTPTPIDDLRVDDFMGYEEEIVGEKMDANAIPSPSDRDETLYLGPAEGFADPPLPPAPVQSQRVTQERLPKIYSNGRPISQAEMGNATLPNRYQTFR